MSRILPHPFFFRYSIPVRFAADRPVKSRPRSSRSVSPAPGLLRLSDEYRLPVIDESQQTADFGTIRLGWNDGGIGIAVDIAGKKHPPVCDADLPTEGCKPKG